jgi:hypothetical protein
VRRSTLSSYGSLVKNGPWFGNWGRFAEGLIQVSLHQLVARISGSLADAGAPYPQHEAAPAASGPHIQHGWLV